MHQGGIDIASGLYGRKDDDLIVNTPMPIVLRRTYNSGDRIPRQFGVGTTHPGEWWLYGDGDPRVPWGDLILPDGGRIRFTRISPGDTQKGAVLRHDTTPTEFNGALLSWNGSTWDMRLRDGSSAVFSDCPNKQDTCALLERRDANGHRIVYLRDWSGRLLKMESEGESITFQYDVYKRIVRAYDTSQHSVRYTYDTKGRLVSAAHTEGTIRRYGYDDTDHLTSIREPGRIVQNWYDEAGRVIRQEVRETEDDNDPYVATVCYMVEDGLIVQTDFDEGNGVQRTRYSRDHYVMQETFGADGALPITFTYTRDASNTVNGMTLSCRGANGQVTRSIPIVAYKDDELKARFARETCVVLR